MTDAPKFQMIGEPDALVCEDGACTLPEPATGSEPAE